MGLLEMWIAVGDDYRFQRTLHGRTADVYRHGKGWVYVVSDGSTVLGEGRATTWDEASSLAHAMIVEAASSFEWAHSPQMRTHRQQIQHDTRHRSMDGY